MAEPSAEPRPAASLITVEVVDPADPVAQVCLQAYYAELDRRFDAGFSVDEALPLSFDEMRPPRGLFLVAALRSEPIGCGGLKLHGDDPAEIKRMWVSPAARGLGVGRRLLTALEERAAALGAPAVQLETNRSLVEAIALYRSSGYDEVPAFNDEIYGDHWFEKRLDPP